MSVKLTVFGQFVRKLRVTHGEYLKDMAKRLDVTPSYLSAVECGRRNAPYEWVEKLRQSYGLSSEDTDELREAVSDSRYYDKLDIAQLSFEDKKLVECVVERLPHFDGEAREQLYELLDRHG